MPQKTSTSNSFRFRFLTQVHTAHNSHITFDFYFLIFIIIILAGGRRHFTALINYRVTQANVTITNVSLIY